MTVKELKEKIENLDENLEVMVRNRDFRIYPIDDAGKSLTKDYESAFVMSDEEIEKELKKEQEELYEKEFEKLNEGKTEIDEILNMMGKDIPSEKPDKQPGEYKSERELIFVLETNA